MPNLSVVMPVFNGEKFLKPAIESILNQGYQDFEFIIIDDGSTDRTAEIIQTFKDPRINYISNDQNLGLSKSFNIGIKASTGHYIARMDADDMALPQRFEKQINFLESHPEIGIVGSAVRVIDENGFYKNKLAKPRLPIELKWQSLFSTPFFHPTIIARGNILKENPFDETLHNSEDYELWSRLIFGKDIKLANLAEPLLLYRIHKSSFTQTLNTQKRIASATNVMRNLERYTSLTLVERGLITEFLQNHKLTLKQLVSIAHVYSRAAQTFLHKENYKPSLRHFYLSLLKYQIKHYLR
jgi:glycosyltransferase involved in cell wall biosynthesis